MISDHDFMEIWGEIFEKYLRNIGVNVWEILGKIMGKHLGNIEEILDKYLGNIREMLGGYWCNICIIF